MAEMPRTTAALKRLHVSERDVAAAPPLSSLLKKSAGGMKQVYAAMRMSQDEVVKDYLKKYDAIPVGDRRYLSMEAVALAAEVDLNCLFVSAMIALQAQAVNLTKIIAVTNHPKITAARVKYGQLPYGERDRTALDTAVGFLPSPQGTTFIGHAVFGSGKNVMDAQRGAAAADSADAEDGFSEEDPDLDKIFPPANQMQQRLLAIRQKMLPPSS